jgi:hypothetical protein
MNVICQLCGHKHITALKNTRVKCNECNHIWEVSIGQWLSVKSEEINSFRKNIKKLDK